MTVSRYEDRLPSANYLSIITFGCIILDVDGRTDLQFHVEH